MTHAKKVSSALIVLLRESFSDPVKTFNSLHKYSIIETDSFDTQLYFNSFYLSFTYYRREFSSMSLYTNRFDVECPLICLERNGDILIGKAFDRVNIYNGCAPSAQDMQYIGLEMATFQYLVEVKAILHPMLEEIAKRYLH